MASNHKYLYGAVKNLMRSARGGCQKTEQATSVSGHRQLRLLRRRA